MEKWCKIRQRVLRKGESIRQIRRKTGLHFQTVKKILTHASPPAFRGPERPRPKTGPYLKRISQEVFVPLVHRPGEAQADFGQALVKMGGVLRKVLFFAMVPPYSDAMFIAAYPRECTETFQDGHVRAFDFFQGAPPPDQLR